MMNRIHNNCRMIGRILLTMDWLALAWLQELLANYWVTGDLDRLARQRELLWIDFRLTGRTLDGWIWLDWLKFRIEFLIMYDWFHSWLGLNAIILDGPWHNWSHHEVALVWLIVAYAFRYTMIWLKHARLPDYILLIIMLDYSLDLLKLHLTGFVEPLSLLTVLSYSVFVPDDTLTSYSDGQNWLSRLTHLMSKFGCQGRVALFAINCRVF